MSNHNPLRVGRKYTGAFQIALFLIALGPGSAVTAQDLQAVAKAAVPATSQVLPSSSSNTVPQSVIASLASLPEADTLVYINPRLIINEAAARVLPEKDLAEMRKGFGEMKKDTGLDPGNIDYIVSQIRFKKPNANLDFSLPEFMMVVGGDFDAEALVKFAGQAFKERLRTEAYGSKTLSLMTIDELAEQARKTPLLKSLTEVAIVAVNGNTVALGTTSYVKAAIDAAGGKGRISTDLLNSVLRDPNALISTAGSPWTAFAKTFALLGTENNPRAARCDNKLGDFYAAITMDANSFKFRGAMNADNPDTAKIIKSLLSMLLTQAADLSKDKSAQAILKSLTITPTDTEVLVQAEVSQQAVVDFIQEQSHPKQPTVTAPAETKPKAATKATPRRRRHRTTTKKTV